MAFYSAYRLKRFGLDGVIDVLFSPKDHDTPAGVSLDKMRRLPDEFYELQVTRIEHTPPGELKPNPRVLVDIIRSVGATVDRCAYVGDSLFKDVAMARDANVFDIYAKYGVSQGKPEYELLRRVSHWTDADVERERAIVSKGADFQPTAVLNECFAEIFAHCEFEQASSEVKFTSKEEMQNAIEVWKKTVDVHQHFNDLGMRIRNFAITIVGILIASIGFTYQQGLEINLFGQKFSSGIGLVVAAAIAWAAFFVMDRFWFHIFLRGAVRHAAKIETRLKDKVPDIGLGGTISDVSGNIRVMGVKMNSERRLTTFYVFGFAMLAVVFACLFLGAPSRTQGSAQTKSPPDAQSQPPQDTAPRQPQAAPTK